MSEPPEEPTIDVAELLLKLGVVETGDLDAIAGLRESLADRDEALKLGAGVRGRLGELLAEANRVLDGQISQSLLEQQKTGEKLGDILVRLGYLSIAERDIVLEFQRYQDGRGAAGSDKLRLGRILVSTGEISEAQLANALERAHTAGHRLGEELIAEGCLSADRLERALKLQRRLVITALAASLVPATAVYPRHAKAADTRAQMTVSANVVEAVTIRTMHQARDLIITAADVARGYVEVPAASRFQVSGNSLSVLEFRPRGAIVRSFSVTLPEGSARFGPEGGTLLQKARQPSAPTVDVTYRFDLAAGIKPGSHPWPLSLTILPM